MLIVTLEIHLRRPDQFRPFLQHREVRTSGIEPDVEDVLLLAEHRVSARASVVRRKEILDIVLVPGVGAFLAKELRHFRKELRRRDLEVALLAEANRNRDPPQSL